MGVKFFGQYLLEKNFIKPDELLKAVEYQQSKNLKLGEYALSKGYLTEKDIGRIQAEQKRVDMQFGEIAVKMNLMTRAQVEEMLSFQTHNHVFLGEALVELGFLTADVLERELALFRKDQCAYLADEISIPSGVRHPGIAREMVGMTRKMLHRLTQLIFKVNDGFISGEEPREGFLLTAVKISGNPGYEYAFLSPEDISRAIAAAFIGEDAASEFREVIADGVREFCNITCGNIISKLSLLGRSMDISPPEEILSSGSGYKLLKGRKAIYYPLVSPRSESLLILIEEE